MLELRLHTSELRLCEKYEMISYRVKNIGSC